MLAVLCALAACGADRDASVTLLLDSTTAHEPREVAVSPVDPALHGVNAVVTRPAAAASPATGAVARVEALRDTVATLDARIRRERSTLVQESAAMRTGDRFSADYARRYDAFRRRELAADSLRLALDRARRRLAPLLDLHAAALSAADAAEGSTVRAKVLRLRADERGSQILPAESDSITLRLPRGRWWLAVTPFDRWRVADIDEDTTLVMSH